MWRSASRTGEVKTPKSRRSLVLPRRAAAALVAHRKLQAAERLAAGTAWNEGRHTAVSIMSSNGVPLQDISDTVGHKSTHVTETVYRHVIVPAIRGGASVMDTVFGGRLTK